MQCSAKTKSGKRCRRKASEGSEFCGVHAKLAGTVQTAFEYDVFLSYSAKDKQTVHALAERLRGDGVRVWLDVWEIEPGDPISMKIQHAVEKARTTVMCMSPDYFESDWGRLEHHSMLFRDPTNVQRRFLPLLIKDCQPPDIIAQFAHIDWRTSDDEEYDKLLSACRIEKQETEEPSVSESVGEARMVLKEHDSGIWGLAVTPDGKTVVSASGSTLRLWDLESGHCQATLSGHSGDISHLSLTPDGDMVISGSNDKTLKVWDISRRL